MAMLSNQVVNVSTPNWSPKLGYDPPGNKYIISLHSMGF